MKRKTAAVFISNLYNDMVSQTARGVIESARSHDAKLVFFTIFADNSRGKEYARTMEYETGDFVAYLLPDLSRYDALISFDTYMPIMYLDSVDRLKAAAPCPVITLGAIKPYACSVVNDQDRSFREVIEHVIDVHGCRDLVHVAGHRELSFVQERIAIFNGTLEARGLPHGEDRVFYGDLSPRCGDRIVDEMLQRRARAGEKPLPDAVVCTNDYTAIGIVKALENRGCRVPGDVIVTGYDDILRAQFNEPSITTSAQPFREVGWEGMEAVARLWRGEAVDSVIAVPGILARRQSCGCEPLRTYKKDAIRDKYIATVSNLESLALSTTDLTLKAATDTSIKDIFDEIERDCLRETGFQNAVLCLIENWDTKKVVQSREDLEGVVFDVVCGVWNGRPVRRERLERGALLPRELMEDPEPYFIFPVHHLQYFLGYFIISPNLVDLGQLHIRSWLVNISTVLVNWCIRQQLTLSVAKLDHLYQTDMLTGLYNRRGYNRFFDAYYNQCRAEGRELTVFMIDMNHMKQINDRFGHAEGDYALCAIAEAMRACAGDGDICIRSGGDEFVILSQDCDAARAEAFGRRLCRALDRICARDGKPYSVSVSVGCCRRVPGEASEDALRHEAEAFLRDADKAMYAEKERSRGKR